MKRLLILGFLVLASIVPGGMAAKAEALSISDYLGNYMYPLIMSAFTTRPDQSELYEFTMAGQKFRMPYYYFASSRLPPSGSTIHKGDGLHMTFLWPDLEPPTSENIEEFRRVGWGRTIMLLVQERNNQLAGQALVDVKMEDTDQKACWYQAPSHKICPGVSHLENDNIHIIERKEDTFLFSCSKDGIYPSPDCSKRKLLPGGIHLNYSFSKKYVTDIQEIERELIALFRRYLVTDQ